MLCLLLPLSSFGITRHAVIVVMDGARYTETMGDQTHANVPKIAALASQGVVLSAFRTAKTGSIAESWTETCPGHARMTTGTYQNIANDGTELPSQPSMFQHYRQQKSGPATSGWVICSKDKLFILANSSASGWNNQYRPSMNCGVNGDGSGGYREDNLTHDLVLQKLVADRPALMIINYKGPDAMGHANDWNGYLAAIREIDGYADDIWNTIQADDSLANTTALFIVNDHGRHTTDFTSHGDNCAGCRTIMCVALGPDIKTNATSSTTREQIDLAPTIASMMGFTMPTSTGTVMTEIIKPSTSVKRGDEAGLLCMTPGKISVTASSNRSVVFSNLPEGAVIDIMNVSGAHVARIATNQATAIWSTAGPPGAPMVKGYFVCTLRNRHVPTVLMHVMVP
jgi:hypothetical protein